MCDYDAVYVMGDFNSRIWPKDDYIQEIDNIPKRNTTDVEVNKHS